MTDEVYSGPVMVEELVWILDYNCSYHMYVLIALKKGYSRFVKSQLSL